MKHQALQAFKKNQKLTDLDLLMLLAENAQVAREGNNSKADKPHSALNTLASFFTI